MAQLAEIEKKRTTIKRMQSDRENGNFKRNRGGFSSFSNVKLDTQIAAMKEQKRLLQHFTRRKNFSEWYVAFQL